MVWLVWKWAMVRVLFTFSNIYFLGNTSTCSRSTRICHSNLACPVRLDNLVKVKSGVERVQRGRKGSQFIALCNIILFYRQFKTPNTITTVNGFLSRNKAMTLGLHPVYTISPCAIFSLRLFL